MSNDLFVEALDRLIDQANGGITHAEFVSGVESRTVGFKCMRGEPHQFVRGVRLGIFNALVLLYMVLPLIAIPLWAWHEHNWWLLGGVGSSAVGSIVAARLGRSPERQNSVGGFLAFGALVFWFFTGIHSYLTFYFLTALWGLMLFMMAEAAQREYALQSFVENPGLFDAAVASKRIMIVRSPSQAEQAVEPVPNPDSTAEPNGLKELQRASDSFDSAREKVAPFSISAEKRRRIIDARREFEEAGGGDQSAAAKYKDVIAEFAPADFGPYTAAYLDSHTNAMISLSFAFQTLTEAFNRMPLNDEAHPVAVKLYGLSAQLYRIEVDQYADAAHFSQVDGMQGEVDASKAALDRLFLTVSQRQTPIKDGELAEDKIFLEAKARSSALQAAAANAERMAKDYRRIADEAEAVSETYAREDS